MNYPLQAVTANGIAAIVLVFMGLSFRSKFAANKADMKVFSVMMAVNLFLCVVEASCIILDGVMFPGAIVLTTVLNALLYVGNILFTVLWLIFAQCRIQGHMVKPTRLQLAMYIPALLILLGAVVNLFTPVYFEITQENVYQRRGIFLLAYAVSYLYLIIGTVVVYGLGYRKDRYVIRPAVTFLLPVFAASILQYLFPGISLLWVGAALSMTFAYVSLLDESVAIDPVSGAFTRHYMTRDLNVIHSQPRAEKLVAGIILDIDEIRQINEGFGYGEGDQVIRKIGRLLRRTVGQEGTVYRYLDGVFAILLHLDRSDEIDKLLVSIDEQIRTMNLHKEFPAQIHFSIGYAMLGPEESAASFTSRMEKAVQDEKKRKRQKKDREYKDLAEFYQFNPNRNRILIVNGKYLERQILKNIFPAQFRILEVVDGQEALSMLDVYANSICAILIDLETPGIDGMELLEVLHRRHITRIIPTFLVTEKEAYDVTQQAYSLGAVDVIINPFMPYVIVRRVQSVLALFQARESIQETSRADAGHMPQEEQPAEGPQEQNPAGPVEPLASTIEFRDIETSEHTNRIYNITKHILAFTEMGEGLSQEEIENIAIGSILHDVGKIAISDAILNKPGRVTSEEYEIIKSHTVKGAELVEQLAKTQAHPSYQYALDIARHHHERWDGGGYPDGLKGGEITLWSQVVSIADAYDGLVSPRVYKKVFSPDTAVNMICSGECGVFNPKLLKCFCQVEKYFREWYEDPAAMSSTAAKQLMHHTSVEQDMINVMLLVDAVRINHDQVIYGNLSKNTYTMIGDEIFPFHKRRRSGAFDQLIQEVGQRVPSSHRERFLTSFARDKLLKNYADGIKSVSLGYPEMIEGEELRIVYTTVLLMEDARNGDVLEIALIRYVDQ